MSKTKQEILSLIDTLEFEKECWYREWQKETKELLKSELWIEFERVKKRISYAVDNF